MFRNWKPKWPLMVGLHERNPFGKELFILMVAVIAPIVFIEDIVGKVNRKGKDLGAVRTYLLRWTTSSSIHSICSFAYSARICPPRSFFFPWKSAFCSRKAAFWTGTLSWTFPENSETANELGIFVRDSWAKVIKDETGQKSTCERLPHTYAAHFLSTNKENNCFLFQQGITASVQYQFRYQKFILLLNDIKVLLRKYS